MAWELTPIRARIGLIIPTSNRLTEPQFHRYAPPGVEPHVTRLRMTGDYEAPVDELLPRVVEAAGLLADAKCDIVVFHCTGSSMRSGIAAERRVIAAIEQATGRRATSTAAAVLAALEALGAQRIVHVSPSPSAHEVAFLEAAGFEVLRSRSLDLPGSDAFIATPPSQWLQAVQEEADPRADAYFLACTNTHTPDVIEELEGRLGRPVVTSNQATLWYCLRACSLPDAVSGFGELGRRALATAVPA
jgi:maleate isomerase